MERLRQIPLLNTERAKNTIREDLKRLRHIHGGLVFLSGPILNNPFSPSRNVERIYRYQRYAARHINDENLRIKRGGHELYVVSALNYFTQEALLRLSDRTTSELDQYWETEGHENRRFWQENIADGYFDAVIMTPGWTRSMPAKIEYSLAHQNRIPIFLLKDSRQPEE